MNLLILVVDDEPDVEMLFRQHFRRDLREGRFTMQFAQSGETGRQRIADAAGVSLILMLSDINMPGMTGFELLPKAKAARPDVPVIMITAYGDAETKRKALESGADALFTKPIDFGMLRSEIDTRVEKAAWPHALRLRLEKSLVSTERTGVLTNRTDGWPLRFLFIFGVGQKRLVKATLGERRIVLRRIELCLPFSAFGEQTIALL